MAFNSAAGRAEYTAIATQTAFPFTFKIYLDGDIKVYQTLAGATPDDTADLLTLTTDYTVSISGDNGGTITLVTGAAVGDTITLVRDLSIDRLIEYQNNGDLLAGTLNQDQNYQTYLIADKDAENTRFLRLPNSSQNVSSELPAPLSLNFLQWNTAANALINVNSLQADGFIWTATDVYTKTEANTLLDAKANLSGAVFTGQVSFAKGADVASAAALPILTDGNYFDVTGTTAITSINTTGAIGTVIKLHFDGILTLTHHATDLILPSGANITTAAGDEAEFIEYASGDFRCTSYTRADGTAIVGAVGDTRLNTADEDYAGQAAGEEILNSNAGEWIKNQCTAWVNFDGTTTPPTIKDSFNISSVVRDSTGTFGIFPNGFVSADYSAVFSAGQDAGTNQYFLLGINSQTSSQLNIEIRDASNTAINKENINVIFFGGKA